MALTQIENGIPPVAGGQLDQTAPYLEALRLVTGERAMWRASLGIRGNDA